MATGYNIRNKISQSTKAGRASRVAPAASGVINVSPVGLATVQFDTAGARTLESASNFEIGASVLICATVASVTVNSVAIADGSAALFQVVLSAAGAKEWRSQFVTPAAVPAITGDISTYVEASFKAVLTALAAAGIVVDSTTT